MMKTIVAVLLSVALVALAQQPEDDGSYKPELYEAPYQNGYTGPQPQQQQAYQPQPQAYQQPAYQPQPQAYQQPATYQGNSRHAAIISEQRYLQNDGKFGKFGASYSQEDGVEFKEESDPDGTRRGSYSWVDPSGQRRTVSYTAGKHGFQATGDHLPNGPTGSVLQAQAPYEPQPQYQAPPQQASQPRYESRPAPQPQYRPAPVAQYSPRGRYEVAEEQPVEQYRPAPQPQYRPAPQPQYRPAPQPQYRPAPQQSARLRPSPEFLAGPAHPDIPSSNAQEYTISSSY